MDAQTAAGKLGASVLAGALEIEFGEGPTRNAARWRLDRDMMMILTCLCGLPNLENACARKREIYGPCLGTEEYFWITDCRGNERVRLNTGKSQSMLPIRVSHAEEGNDCQGVTRSQRKREE